MRHLSNLEKYLDKTFGFKGEEPLLRSMSEALTKESLSHMSLSPYEGRILHFLVSFSQSRKVVEIGTLLGHSALWLARALPPEGRLWTLDVDAEIQEKAKKILSEEKDTYDKISWVCGQASQTLQTLKKEGPFDLIFIDADKSSYLDYLDWAEANIRLGGLIVGDNTFLFGALYGDSKESVSDKKKKVMEQFNERLSQKNKYNFMCLPTQEGLTVAQRLN